MLPSFQRVISIHARTLLVSKNAHTLSSWPSSSLAFLANTTRCLSHVSPARFGLIHFLESKICKATHRDTRLSLPSRAPRRPPRPQNKQVRWLDTQPQNYIFYGIMAINGAVFLAWQWADSERRNGDPSSLMFMKENFSSSLNNFSSGRIWTILTSCFSHQGTQHILFNGFTYFFFARPILGVLGNTRFLTLYLGGGTISGVISMWYNNFYKGKENYSSLGASGAIYALLSFAACVAPSTTVLFYGIIPLPIWALVGGIFVVDGYSALNDKQRGTDTMGHVGGLLGGIAYFLARRAGRLP